MAQKVHIICPKLRHPPFIADLKGIHFVKVYFFPLCPDQIEYEVLALPLNRIKFP